MKETPGGTEDPTPSFEELQAAQHEHEEGLEKQEDEKKKEEKARAGAEVGYGERQEALGEARAVQGQIDQLKHERIQERIASRGKLRESEIAKERELEGVNGTIAEIDGQLKKIQSLVTGKDMDKVAPAVKQELERVLAKKEEVTQQSNALANEIGKMKSDEISDDEIRGYQNLRDRVEELSGKVSEIEGNPYVIERLMEEAETENKIRNRVVDATIYGKHTSSSDVWSDFAKEATQLFLSEEFASRGIDAIKDPQEREAAMKKVAGEIMQGVAGSTDWAEDRMSPSRASGRLLKNLTGNYGTLDGTLGFMASAENAVDRYGDKIDEEKMQAAVSKHLKTLNLIRGYSSGIGDRYQRHALGNNGGKLWRSFDSEVRRYGFTTSPEGALIPRGAEGEAVKAVDEFFSKKRNQAVGIDRQLWQAEKTETEKEISERRDRLAELKKQFAEAEDVEERIQKGV